VIPQKIPLFDRPGFANRKALKEWFQKFSNSQSRKVSMKFSGFAAMTTMATITIELELFNS
jgi:hypothetical protein